MSRQSDEELLLRHYLLGELDDAARDRVEERLFGDDDFAERLFAAQDALIDDYALENLPPRERESFDSNFVFDEERGWKLLFARALKIYVDERRGPDPLTRRASHAAPPAWKKPLNFIWAHKTWSGVAAAALVLLVLIAPAALRRLRTPDPAALVRERRAAVERRVAEFNKRPADESIRALPSTELALLPTRLRDDDRAMPRAVLGNDVKLLALQLPPPAERRDKYSALVLTVEGEELFAVGDLTPQTEAGVTTIPLNIPADLLPTGDYEVRLRAAAADGNETEAGRYNFRVLTQN